MAKIFVNVPYLEDSDISPQGDILIPSPLPKVVLFFASWCGHCKTLVPVYQKFADMTKGKAFVAVVQADGSDTPSQEALGKRIPNIVPNGLEGYPTIVKYDEKGKAVAKYEGDRSLGSLLRFVGLSS